MRTETDDAESIAKPAERPARLVVDWRTNADRQNEMRNAIDDLLYDVKSENGLALSVEDMDAIIERALDIAKNRYAR